MCKVRAFAAIVAVGLVGVLCDSSSAALARAAGGSGYSGQLSSNRAIRKQQLACDPDDPISGSTSTLYNPAMVTLSNLFFGPGYTGRGVVEVDTGDGRVLQDIRTFLVDPSGSETGYAQVFYSQQGQEVPGGNPSPAGAPGQIPVPAGFFVNDTDGVKGVDTHGFEFTYLDVPDTTVAEYRIFAAEQGERGSGNSEDFLVGRRDDGSTFRLGPNDLSSAVVRGNLIPLPPAVFAGGATLVGVFAAMKRRKLIAR
jgi:hypothetical protein